jgi:hypothetical protein
VICTPHGLRGLHQRHEKRKSDRRSLAYPRELADEEGCAVHTAFEILWREEKEHGDRVRSLRKTEESPAAMREKPPKPNNHHCG